ncbi:MAG TPA: hypothetical protein VM368_09275 [Flavisolibacter sp.]|nr:hypothetical protein [Flavisolibacter sp.]
MKKVLLSLLTLLLLSDYMNAQTTTKPIRPASIGISFILNDFETPARIRSTSFGAVRRDDRWLPFREQSPGIALSYFRGITPHIDFAGTLAGSFVSYATENKPNTTSDAFLLEADASANFKLFSENYSVTPYAIGGVGASMYRSSFGAFMPLGLGLKLNLYKESDILLTFQYRVPVTTQTTAYHFFTSLGITGLLDKD